jgi:hypothetical protein
MIATPPIPIWILIVVAVLSTVYANFLFWSRSDNLYWTFVFQGVSTLAWVSSALLVFVYLTRILL